MLTHRLLSLVLSVATAVSAAAETVLSARTDFDGFAPFIYKGELYQTYYRVIGHLQPDSTPALVLHGGPGLSHEYLIPFTDIVQPHRPIVLYDQIGNARSSHIHDKPDSFWTMDLFMDELENLLRYLSIRNYELIGHSWGGILASEFVARRAPTNIKHLIITDSPASAELMGESHMKLLQEFPEDIREGFLGGVTEENLEAFHRAFDVYYGVHAITVRPIPAEFTATMDWIFGPNRDITVTSSSLGNDWSIVGRANQIKVTTLVLNGRGDIVQDFATAPFFREIPRVKWITFQNATHTPFWEQRADYFRVVNDFLSL